MKLRSKLYSFPFLDIINKPIIKGFQDLKTKIDFDVTKEQLLSEFKFNYYEEEMDWCGGFFDFFEKEIVISTLENDLYKEATFCHEFGHLLQYHFNFSKELLFPITISGILKKEQEAETLGILVWSWLHPNQEFPGFKDKEFLPYFYSYGINFTIDMNKNFFENDLKNF